MSGGAVAAVDLGATSGRVMIGHVGHNELSVRPVARFPNGPVTRRDGLHWDVTALYEHALSGLASALVAEPDIRSIGIDSWAVDYGQLRGGRMLAEPFHYRDDRTAEGVAAVHAIISPEELYRRNGLQFLPFNTLYQFAADRGLADADAFLLIPDLLAFWLTGNAVAERTNASTTGLLGVASRRWDDELIERLGFPRRTFPELVDSGETIGALLPAIAGRIGARHEVQVTAVGSHDTASAVVAVPAASDDIAYISCGTWGLVGVELESPITTDASRAANFTNEGGVDGRVRFLHNVMGLWLLSECVRTWEAAGEKIDLPDLIARAAALPEPAPVFDANDARFLAPGDLPARIAEWLTEHDLPVPRDHIVMTRSIIESLADAFAHAVHAASALSGRPLTVIHIVGGGSQNVLLCQLTADRSGLPVVAGPVEATAVGNVLIQARAQGFVSGSLESLRALVARAFAPTMYRPV
jgi:rhamnulokinase